MPSSITIKQQHLEATDIGDISVTTVEQDLNTGDWVRVIRIFGRDPVSGEVGDLMIEIRLTAATAARLNISVPASEF